MVSIDVEQICLLELIKAALFNSVPEIPNNANWEKILETAKSQCIVSLIASVVPNEHSSEWTKMSCQSKAKFIKLLYEQTSLINMFKNNDIPLIILKGTATSIYFPVPSARTFGDIDLFVPNDFADSARKLLEENGYVLIHI